MSLRKLDIDDFIIMLLVMQGFNLSKTANLLCITQPAISQRIKKIEEIFGFKVLDKTYRNGKLTIEGEDLAYSFASAFEMLVNTIPDTSSDGWRDTLINLILSERGNRPANECN